MNEATVEELFEEFARAYRRGDRPDVRETLARAGSEREREALGNLIDRYLQAMPALPPTEEELVLMRARLEQEPPLLVLRLQRRLTRDAVVDALVRGLGLDPAKREKVARYYHELEAGLLDPAPVDTRVWDALDAFLSAKVRALAGLRLTPAVAEARYRRDADFSLELQAPAPAAEPAERAERDEVDRLFTGDA